MRFAVIAPARRASSRLADKMLADIGGEVMIVRTLRRAAQSQAAKVLVATDDGDIAAACKAAGFEAVMTGECDSGSARAAAAAGVVGAGGDDIVVNVQGDEPFIEPEVIDGVAELLHRRKDCVCATAVRELQSAEEFYDRAVVKVVSDVNDCALYFSRAPIPASRDSSSVIPAQAGISADSRAMRDSRLRGNDEGGGNDGEGGDGDGNVPQIARAHIGIYAYRAGFLRKLPNLTPSPMESIESLEQLRVLWHGEKIALLKVQSKSFGIDTEDDLSRARQRASAEL